MRAALIVLAGGLAATVGSAIAQRAGGGTVIYTCTDAAGQTTVQNGRPCPRGSRQTVRNYQAPAASPPRVPVAPPPPPPPPATAAPAPEGATASTAHGNVLAVQSSLPPPPIFECRTRDNGSYLSETIEQPERCIPIAVTAIDGVSPAAGTACEMTIDQCQRVPDQAACEAWRRRVRETLSAWKFGLPDQAARHQADYERALKITAETRCSLPGDGLPTP